LIILSPFDSSRFSGQTSRTCKGIPKKDISMFHEKKDISMLSKKVSFTYNPEAPFGLELIAERERRGHLLK
jgi:hypothetical protein